MPDSTYDTASKLAEEFKHASPGASEANRLITDVQTELDKLSREDQLVLMRALSDETTGSLWTPHIEFNHNDCSPGNDFASLTYYDNTLYDILGWETRKELLQDNGSKSGKITLRSDVANSPDAPELHMVSVASC